MEGCFHEYELISGRFKHPVVRCRKCGRKYDLKNHFRLKPALISIPILALSILLSSTVLSENHLLDGIVFGIASFFGISLTNWLTRRIYAPKLLADPETYGDRMSSDL